MKKARKKRIVRRKRRISEREIMRIKRKLKKSARKLRLGAKRTGAYVYGTLRRIVGNPMEKMGVYAGRDGFEIADFKKGDRIQLHPGMDLWMRGAKYGQIIGIGRKKLQVKLDYLRRPIAVSPRNIGEIMYREIGENRRRTAGRRRMVRVLGYDVVEGSKKHMRLLAQKRHFDDLQKSERGLRGNPLSYYVGGLSSLGAKRESQRRVRTYNQIKKSIQRGNASYGELAVLQSLAKEHPKLFAGDPMMAEAGGISEAQFRRLRGNPSFASLHPRDRATADKFVDYVYGFYGKGGLDAGDFGNRGFTRREIERAVAIYIDQIRKKRTEWGGGDSIDRERVRKILQPSYSFA